MNNVEAILQHVATQLDASDRTMRDVENDLRDILRTLNDMERHLSKSKDGQGIERGLQEIAGRVDAVGSAVAGNAQAYMNAQRGFEEILRHIR
ncbi:MAG: hypothetical protein ABI670_13905 [Chloroflexota bacterium]